MVTRNGNKTFWLSRVQEDLLFSLLGDTSNTSLKAFILSRAKQEVDFKAKQLEQQQQQKTNETELKA